jgi:hypothetical protein
MAKSPSPSSNAPDRGLETATPSRVRGASDGSKHHYPFREERLRTRGSFYERLGEGLDLQHQHGRSSHYRLHLNGQPSGKACEQVKSRL